MSKLSTRKTCLDKNKVPKVDWAVQLYVVLTRMNINSETYIAELKERYEIDIMRRLQMNNHQIKTTY